MFYIDIYSSIAITVILIKYRHWPIILNWCCKSASYSRKLCQPNKDSYQPSSNTKLTFLFRISWFHCVFLSKTTMFLSLFLCVEVRQSLWSWTISLLFSIITLDVGFSQQINLCHHLRYINKTTEILLHLPQRSFHWPVQTEFVFILDWSLL